MPAAAVINLLKKESKDPSLAQVDAEADEAPLPTRGGMAPRGRAIPGNEERMRRHLTDMQRLMNHLREEMDGVEEP